MKLMLKVTDILNIIYQVGNLTIEGRNGCFSYLCPPEF